MRVRGPSGLNGRLRSPEVVAQCGADMNLCRHCNVRPCHSPLATFCEERHDNDDTRATGSMSEKRRDLILPCAALLAALVALVVEMALNIDSTAAAVTACLICCGVGVVVGAILGRAR